MLAETATAIFLLVWLVLFSSVNLYNIFKAHKHRRSVKAYAEVDRPSAFLESLAAVGTLVYFVEALLFLFLAFAGLIPMLSGFLFYLRFPFTLYTRILGVAFTSGGYSLFIWSVIIRGRYAVSWKMPENHRLVTSGPYHYVRHPSYLGYFLMFFGLFFLWPNMPTLLPLVAIPGYYRVTFQEEELLVQRFGRTYVEYQKKTGRFVPKFR